MLIFSPLTRSWSLKLTITVMTFRSLISGFSAFGGSGGGKRLEIPESVLIEDVNKKKVSNKNEMSDMDPPLTPGDFFTITLIF
ncbi:hypothetical protein FACS1894201_11810 [Bacteroidia bacterium]|nr:hypothetical protein FACS1894201_11810 [Bacteroidia bacterium]